MLVAAVVGVPIFFLLLITIGPADQQFNDMYGMLDQVASYQLIGEALSFSSLQVVFVFSSTAFSLCATRFPSTLLSSFCATYAPILKEQQ